MTPAEQDKQFTASNRRWAKYHGDATMRSIESQLPANAEPDTSGLARRKSDQPTADQIAADAQATVNIAQWLGLRLFLERSQWPFPPPGGPIPKTEQEKRDSLGDAPF